MSVVFRESAERPLLSSLDVGLLSVRDRACLRLLYRAGVATADQLATLVFPSRRTALRRLRRLWQLGLLERAPLAPERGGIPVAYRISRRGSKRLGYHDTRSGGVGHVRHSLDTVDAVCALVRPAPDCVRVWLTEPMVDTELPPDVRPDSVVGLQLGGGSAVLCLEVDEATEHSPTIRARLGAYERALAGRTGWHAVWIVPSEERRGWLRRVGRWDDRAGLEGASWGVVLDDLRTLGLRAPTHPVGWSGGAVRQHEDSVSTRTHFAGGRNVASFEPSIFRAVFDASGPRTSRRSGPRCSGASRRSSRRSFRRFPWRT